MANRFIERLRGKVPYIRRLHREIDDLHHRLAAAERLPVVYQIGGYEPSHLSGEFRAFLRLLQPHDVTGHNKQRVGTDRDGGYVMLDDYITVRHALSLGIGLDVSWDIAMADRGIRVLQYDHSVNASPQANGRFVFHRRRVVAMPQAPEDITLAQIMAGDPLTADDDIVAKVDIEGAEWDLLARTDTDVLARIRQLAIEFHWLRNFADTGWRATAIAALRNLTATHCCIHVHGTNYAPFAVIGGVPFPEVFEATFVRRTDYRTFPSDAAFPTELDRPSNPKKPDLFLGRWSY